MLGFASGLRPSFDGSLTSSSGRSARAGFGQSPLKV